MQIDLDAVERLASIMAENDLSSLEIREGESQIALKRPEKPSPQASQGGALPASSGNVPLIPSSEIKPSAENILDFNHTKELKSPMVGVVYMAPEPGAEPFVKVGSRVKKGQVLCIIEAMKLMNEFTADEDGEIADICVENEELVEFGQVLFKLY